VVVIRRRVVVWGQVQGVFFRDTCRREATRHGVSGWVCNRPDGAVEAVFEGSSEAVEAMCAWCESGPPYASVTRVEVTEEPPRSEPGFRIVGYAPE
jgi:acylphosphatase